MAILSKQKIARMEAKLQDNISECNRQLAYRLNMLGHKKGYSVIATARGWQEWFHQQIERLRDQHRAAVRGDMLSRFDERTKAFNMTGTRCTTIDKALGMTYRPIQRTVK